MRAAISIVVLACGVLASAGLHNGTQQTPRPAVDVSPLKPARLSITTARRQLSMRGTTVSEAHELALRQLAADLFGEFELQAEFRPGVLPRRGWALTSSRVLYVVAAMDSADVDMDSNSVTLRGVVSDAAGFGARMAFLREALPNEVELVADVVFVRSRASLDELCQKAFSELVLEPVSFSESSTEIRPASLVTLDRITEFADDCPSVTIAISGHTDASGNEAWNRQLSLARAQAVADRIAANGIDPARLEVSGYGSSVPIADNSTASGRQLNRRIEFELRERY
jgi:OOP family OmpA-OmpF porin